jgi:hypothetical protein
MGLPLITLAEVKAYAGITSTNQDVEINALIPRVTEYVKTYCRRTFIDYVDDAKIDISNGENCAYIYTSEPKIIEISSVEYSDDYGLTYTTLTEYTDYVLDIGNDRVQIVGTGVFTTRINGYKITYNAGYEEIPTDLKQAVLDLVVYYMKNDMAVKSNKSAGTNSVQIEYVTTNSLPSHISRVLNLYVKDWS